ncbi:MLO-like protein 13 isoform X1 [Phragmites australis]|uniref:MLO-like protein 13 isoform X1 n=1 Tax=Phragmites australis TaxID=29695 RepID=UPI002D77CEC5|nr:MLO-like protein 13 isoform X1 [Phragmites australis]
MGEEASLAHTPTWVVAAVCLAIVSVSLAAERFLHYLGKSLKHKEQKTLYSALQRLKEELMLLGFISFFLSLSQGFIVHICIPEAATHFMLPCKKENPRAAEQGAKFCKQKGYVPLLSLEALYQLHIFIFVLGLVHVVFCATTILLGGAKMRKWKHWETGIHREIEEKLWKAGYERKVTPLNVVLHRNQGKFVSERTQGFLMKLAVVSWIIAFLKQFYNSVSKSDYEALRSAFVWIHYPKKPDFDFHKYMIRALEHDFKRVVGISWYLWLFVIFFLLLNINGWHTYFWLAFLPIFLLLIVGAKLEHIITRLAQDAAASLSDGTEGSPKIKPSKEHFWFHKPGLVLHLIHFILFQNSFEIGIRRVQFVHDGTEGLCHFQACYWCDHRSCLQLHHSAIIRHRYSYGWRHQAASFWLGRARFCPELGHRGPEEENPGARRAPRELARHADSDAAPRPRRDRLH